jgi:glycosyltransferase involved in cell wall biosynthesis
LSGPGSSGRGAGAPRVIIAHDNLYWYGGAERIAAAIATVFPSAPFWTFIGRNEVARRMGVADRYHSILPESSALLRGYRALAPAYPALALARRLPEADLLITSSFAFAHHLRTVNDAPQLCYCYSPLRAAWSMTEDYGRHSRGGSLGAGAAKLAARVARRVDRRASRRVTRYVAESGYVAAQISRFYQRQAEIIYPPVDTELFRPPEEPGHDDYFLFSGRLVEAYKRPTAVVEAFATLPHRLVIAGDGPARAQLERIAGPNVEFVGHVGDADLVALMQRCAAVVFPSRDDFGLIPVEVMACGRPVLAYGAGGALETVVPGKTGELFDGQDPPTVREAVRAFDPDAYDPAEIRAHAERFGLDRFLAEIRSAAESVLAAGR